MKFTVWLCKATGLLLLSVVALHSTVAHATLLPAGGTLNPAPSALDTGGTQLATESPTFSASTYAGTLTSTVDVNDPSNPFGAGDLTFTFQMTNIEASLGAITRLSVSGFSGLSVDASYVSEAGQTYPAYITRSSNGSVIGFNFLTINGTTPLNPGGTSTELVLQTNATAYEATTAAIIGGAITSPATYMPTPEPSTIMLAFSGLAALVAVGWRRRQFRRLA